MNKIAILVKTSLQFDGRVIQQIDQLSSNYKDSKIKIFLLPDAKLNIDFDKNCKVEIIKLSLKFLPKIRFFQLFKMLEYGIVSSYHISRFNPDLLHVHDDTSSLGGILFKLFNKNKPLIYDDHELKYVRPTKLFDFLMFNLEKLCYMLADIVIVANDERRRICKKIYSKKNIHIIENFYYRRSSLEYENSFDENNFSSLINFKKQNLKLLLHQGQLTKERGFDQIVDLVNNIEKKYIVIFVGVSQNKFEDLKTKIIEDKRKNIFYFGFVPYNNLNRIYELCDYSIILYKNKGINNKYCAPNRLYMSLYFKLPIIVNEENLVLNNFIKKYNCGAMINKNSNLSELFRKLKFVKFSKNNILKSLYDDHRIKILNIYKELYHDKNYN